MSQPCWYEINIVLNILAIAAEGGTGLVLHLQEKMSYGKNFEKLRSDAEAGDYKAQYLLSLALAEGFGVERNIAQSTEELKSHSSKTAAWASKHLPIGSHGGGRASPQVVLLVEDSLTTRTKVRLLLEKHVGCIVVEAKNGEFARSYLETEPMPDLIITDIHMPGLDGFGLLEHIQHSPRFNKIPVIVLSSDQTKVAVVRGINVGIRHWLLKSTSPDQILNIVKAMLPKPKVPTNQPADSH